MLPSLRTVLIWLPPSLRTLTAKWGLYTRATPLGVLCVNYFIFHFRVAELILILGPNFTVAPGYEHAYTLGTCLVGFVNLFTVGGPSESFCDFLMVIIHVLPASFFSTDFYSIGWIGP